MGCGHRVLTAVGLERDGNGTALEWERILHAGRNSVHVTPDQMAVLG